MGQSQEADHCHRAPTRVATSHTPNTDFQATIQIESLATDGLTRSRRAFTTKPIAVMAKLLDAMQLAGEEARRLEVESQMRYVTILGLILGTN